MFFESVQKKSIQHGNGNRTGTWSFTGELPKNTEPRFQKRPRLIHSTSLIVSTKNLCKKPNNLECETRNLDAGASRRKRSDVCCVQEGFWSRTRCSCYGGIFTWSLRTVATLERRSQQLHQYQEIHGLYCSSQYLKGQFAPKSKLHISPFSCRVHLSI